MTPQLNSGWANGFFICPPFTVEKEWWAQKRTHLLGCFSQNVGRATALSLPDISAFDEGTTEGKPIIVSYLNIEMSGINSMPDLQGWHSDADR